MPELRIRESYVEVEDGFQVWTQILGGGGKNERPALLILHGGPGGAHDYLDNLAALATDNQPVVFYDQLGCGKSDQPNDPARWTLSRFVLEVGRVRQALNLNKVIILGQSFGGMLAIEYLLNNPEGVVGLILSNSLSSAPLLGSEIGRLKNELPASTLDVLEAHEADGTVDSPEYKKAAEAFYSRHILRMDPLPEAIAEVLNAQNQVYEVMWGKNEFNITGNLKNWDRTGDLEKINLPTLIISGEFDESTPKVNQTMRDGLKKSEWILMPGCSHLSNLESPDAYFKFIQNFLDQINMSHPLNKE